MLVLYQYLLIVSLKVCASNQITYASILSVSTHCTGLQSLNVEGCHQITDASIISISTVFIVLDYNH